nr:hypothetical protein [Mycoplasmopsis bovis]
MLTKKTTIGKLISERSETVNLRLNVIMKWNGNWIKFWQLLQLL